MCFSPGCSICDPQRPITKHRDWCWKRPQHDRLQLISLFSSVDGSNEDWYSLADIYSWWRYRLCRAASVYCGTAYTHFTGGRAVSPVMCRERDGAVTTSAMTRRQIDGRIKLKYKETLTLNIAWTIKQAKKTKTKQNKRALFAHRLNMKLLKRSWHESWLHTYLPAKIHLIV